MKVFLIQNKEIKSYQRIYDLKYKSKLRKKFAGFKNYKILKFPDFNILKSMSNFLLINSSLYN